MLQIRGVLIVSQCVAVPDIPNWGGCVNCGCPRIYDIIQKDDQLTMQAMLLGLLENPDIPKNACHCLLGFMEKHAISKTL